MITKLVVFGITPFAEMVAHAFETRLGHEVVAQVAHRRFLPSVWTAPRPLVAFEEIETRFHPTEHQIFIALEHSRNNLARSEISIAARAKGYRLASFVDPSASLAPGVLVGDHCLILHNVVAQYGVEIGSNVIVGANCFFGQNARIGEDGYYGSGVFVDRFARIGRNCVLGSQVRVAEGAEIHAWTYIKSFQTIEASIQRPTLIHPGLRRPGRIVDRRRRTV